MRSAIALVVAIAVTGLGQEPVRDPAKLLLGSWKMTSQGETTLLEFQPARCLLHEKNALQVFAAEYQPGKVILRSFGRKAVWQVEQKSGELQLVGADGKQRYRLEKLPKVPPELEIKPWPMAPSGDLPLAQIRAIQDDLARRLKEDQAVRLDPARFKDMPRVDADNTGYLLRLVQEVGWIDAGRFGKDTSGAALLIVQHSGHLPLMLGALPRIESDYRAGRLDAQRYAVVHDLVQLMLGDKQRYGTQIGQNDRGKWVVLPMQDPARVGEFRKQLGLPPLADYLDLFKQTNGIREILLQDDD